MAEEKKENWLERNKDGMTSLGAMTAIFVAVLALVCQLLLNRIDSLERSIDADIRELREYFIEYIAKTPEKTVAEQKVE